MGLGFGGPGFISTDNLMFYWFQRIRKHRCFSLLLLWMIKIFQPSKNTGLHYFQTRWNVEPLFLTSIALRFVQAPPWNPGSKTKRFPKSRNKQSNMFAQMPTSFPETRLRLVGLSDYCGHFAMGSIGLSRRIYWTSNTRRRNSNLPLDTCFSKSFALIG